MSGPPEDDPVKALWVFAATNLSTDKMSEFGKLLDRIPVEHRSWSKALRACITTRFTNAGREYYGLDAEKFRAILAEMEKKD